MARKSPYPAEMRARAVRIVGEVRPNYDGVFAAIKAVAAQLDIGSAETLRKWVCVADENEQELRARADVVDDAMPLSSLLQKCIMLGGQAGSEKMRD